MKHSVIGMDIAKDLFQLHTVDRETEEVERIKLRRGEVLDFFTRRAPTLLLRHAAAPTNGPDSFVLLVTRSDYWHPGPCVPLCCITKPMPQTHGPSGLRCNSQERDSSPSKVSSSKPYWHCTACEHNG